MTFPCPYCDEELPDPGMGFADHLEESPDCAESHGVTSEAAIRDSGYRG